MQMNERAKFVALARSLQAELKRAPDQIPASGLALTQATRQGDLALQHLLYAGLAVFIDPIVRAVRTDVTARMRQRPARRWLHDQRIDSRFFSAEREVNTTAQRTAKQTMEALQRRAGYLFVSLALDEFVSNDRAIHHKSHYASPTSLIVAGINTATGTLFAVNEFLPRVLIASGHIATKNRLGTGLSVDDLRMSAVACRIPREMATLALADRAALFAATETEPDSAYEFKLVRTILQGAKASGFVDVHQSQGVPTISMQRLTDMIRDQSPKGDTAGCPALFNGLVRHLSETVADVCTSRDLWPAELRALGATHHDIRYTRHLDTRSLLER